MLDENGLMPLRNMKEDHMLNGQLKPGYNWQINTQDQYILGYTLHQTSTDTAALPLHIESLRENLGVVPENPHRTENLHYNEELDCYYCPMGQAMTFIGERTQKTKGNRILDANTRLIKYKQEVRVKLNSETGLKLKYQSQRPFDVEAVFGIKKYNHGFKRFLLRSMEKRNRPIMTYETVSFLFCRGSRI